MSVTTLLWFRQDLRLADNPALAHAVQQGAVLPVYIHDDCAPKRFQLGGASQVWLHHSLAKLDVSLRGCLNLYKGSAEKVIEALVERFNVQHVVWNAVYEPWHRAQSKRVLDQLSAMGVAHKIFDGNHLWGPKAVLKDDGSFYKVFTPYKKRAHTLTPRSTVVTGSVRGALKDTHASCHDLMGLGLLPQHQWGLDLIQHWQVGASSAKRKLHRFMEKGLSGYKDGRNFPAKPHTSELSMHLHFGEISPAQVWELVQKEGPVHASLADREHFLSELTWREFSYYLLYHFPKLPTQPFNRRFEGFPWGRSKKRLHAWQKGLTGYPMVDAGMRELWQTGRMHNRVRMLVASFLVKNLNVHWHHGRDWFWDCLFDADLANNSASWQWVAGCGADAAPYFRIFNPITQGEKFDPEGAYTKKYVPELARLPVRYLFKPWEAPEAVLAEAGVVLGETYPEPIVDLAASRKEALAQYAASK